LSPSYPRAISRLLVVLAFSAPLAASARAGGGPENLVLVVNSASWASQAVANHFVRLRQIPAVNVIYLDWDGGVESIDVESFREKILGVALAEIERRGLTDQIDYVVYSSDFPYAIDLTADFQGQRVPDLFGTVCSINSATYLYPYVLAHNPNVVGMENNAYMRAARPDDPRAATHGFRSWYGWGSHGELLEAGGQHCMLSTMLAVTSLRGNSVGEALSYLRAAAKADGTHPKGTIYFTRTSDVRSTTREPGFAGAVADLKKLGVAAAIVPEEMPSGRPDVQGLTSGVKLFSWRSTGSTILAGAICDNLTSYGGVMDESGSHTPLTEFLRYGAAGASGTVKEPYAKQDKFPVPFVHVHYARGCTLAEAYYQSVFGPYELLIVGDPLCRPWARIPQVEAPGLKANAKVSGKLTFAPAAHSAGGPPADRFELFVDGRRFARCAAGESLSLDSTQLADGYHELRVVAIESGPIESQGRLVVPIAVENRGRSIEFTASAQKSIAWDEPLKLNAKAPGMVGVLFFHNGRLLGKTRGEEGEVVLNPRLFGSGPVVIEALGIARGGPQEYVRARPMHLTVKPGTALAALKKTPPLVRGLVLKLAGGKTVPVQETGKPDWLSLDGVREKETYELSGYFDAPLEDIYQFQVWYFGDLKLSVDGHVLHDGRAGDYRQKFLPVPLAAGVHRLVISGKAADRVQIRVAFGGPGALDINGATFRHTD
jgi:hypothetical protein